MLITEEFPTETYPSGVLALGRVTAFLTGIFFIFLIIKPNLTFSLSIVSLIAFIMLINCFLIKAYNRQIREAYEDYGRRISYELLHRKPYSGPQFGLYLRPFSVAEMVKSMDSTIAHVLRLQKIGLIKLSDPSPPLKPIHAKVYQAPCREPENPGQCDLEAQWEAADGARDAAKWSWWQMIFSAFGLFGLLYNLKLTRKATTIAVEATKDAEKALEIAGRNADAATEQVTVAAKTAQQQLRAYVFAIECRLARYDLAHPIVITVRLKNSGQTPAYDLRVWLLKDAFSEGDKRSFLRTDDATASSTDLGPHTVFEVRLPRTQITPHEAMQIQDKLAILYVFGGLTYRDCFDAEHAAQFCFALGGSYGLPENGVENFAMSHSPEGRG